MTIKHKKRLTTLKKKQAELAAKLLEVKLLEKRAAESERKQFDRAKYMVGGMFFKAFKQGKISNDFFWRLLNGFGNKRDVEWLLDYEFINPDPKLSVAPVEVEEPTGPTE